MRTLNGIIALLFAFIILSGNTVSGQTLADDKSYLQDPEALIRELYKTVSIKAGEKLPDWEKVRNMFYEKANVSLRVSRTQYNIFDTAGFIKDFVDFYQNSKAHIDGFGETILNLKKTVAGKIAHILTLYEARIYGGPSNQGIDSWQLINKDGRWWIFSITNEIIDAKTPIPDILK
jgi:hypothetical protein